MYNILTSFDAKVVSVISGRITPFGNTTNIIADITVQIIYVIKYL